MDQPALASSVNAHMDPMTLESQAVEHMDLIQLESQEAEYKDQKELGSWVDERKGPPELASWVVAHTDQPATVSWVDEHTDPTKSVHTGLKVQESEAAVHTGQKVPESSVHESMGLAAPLLNNFPKAWISDLEATEDQDLTVKESAEDDSMDQPSQTTEDSCAIVHTDPSSLQDSLDRCHVYSFQVLDTVQMVNESNHTVHRLRGAAAGAQCR
jgi:hypothetical protein